MNSIARRMGALVILGIFSSVCPFLLASTSEVALWRYAHRAWTPENSALKSGIRTIAQTPDGYLWLGVDSGLIRFDGMRMFSWTPPPGERLPGIPTHLVGARDGALWIGTTGGLASLKNGRLTQYAALSGFFISNLLEDRDGNVWAAGTWGHQSGKATLCELRNGNATCDDDDGALGAGVSSMFEDASGALWIVTGKVLWHWKPGPPIRYEDGASLTALTQGENDSGFMFYSGGRIRQITGGKIKDYSPPGEPTLTARGFLRDRHGALWIDTSGGLLYSYRDIARLITHSDGLSGDNPSAMFEDHEGTIWIGTSDGLDSFRELPLASLLIPRGLLGDSFRGVLAARDGSLWIGTQISLNRWSDGRMRSYRARTNPGLPSDEIGTLFEDERSRIWIQAYPGVAVFEAESFRAVPSVPPGTITAIASDHHGGVWLQLMDNPNDYGLVHLVDGKVIEEVASKDFGGSPGAGLVVDPDGGVWMGLFSGGIAYFHAGQIRTLQLSGQDTSSRRVFNLSRERDGALWAATENGLSRIADGRVSTLTTANGLPCNVVHWIMDDDISSYWIYTTCGLLRIARSELDAWAADPKRKIQPTIFDSADGIPPRGILLPWRPHVTKAPDGRIWFGNGSKVSVIDPSHFVTNTLPPPIHVEQITADDKTYDARSGLHLPPLVRNVTIDYTALSLVAPEKVRFRYKLEGQDSDWREVVNDREVQYSNLAPRKYRFRVMACNNNGVWNENGDTLEFAIDPAYYQTHWFHALVAGGFYALLWSLYRRRMQRLAHDYTVRAEERVNERTRIARELHDTLLQNIQGALFQFRAAYNLFSRNPEQARSTLNEAIVNTSKALAEARDSIQDLRGQAREPWVLENLLTQAGQDLAAADGSTGDAPVFTVTVEGSTKSLTPPVQEEIYRIGREVLANAFQHAHGRSIEAEIRYDERLFRLRIRDDGIGIDKTVLAMGAREGHWGLPGIRERAKRIGAQVDIWSEPGAGTEIELRVPAAVAYTKSEKPRRFKLFRKRKEVPS